jgi:hypothetical protein
MNLMEWLQDIHHYACQHLNAARDRMKRCYYCLTNITGFQEGDQVWFQQPTQAKSKLPGLQHSWQGSYMLITQINDVVYRAQPHTK